MKSWALYIVLWLASWALLLPLYEGDRLKALVPSWPQARAKVGRWAARLLRALSPSAADLLLTGKLPNAVAPSFDASVAPARFASGEFECVSLAGCSWLMVYHVGVVRCLLEHGLIHREKTLWYGASSGAIMAAAVVCNVSAEDTLNLAIQLARDGSMTSKLLGPVGRMSQYVRAGLESTLPPNAHRLASGRLHVSLTRYPGPDRFLVNEVVTRFASRRELVDVLLASCYIPVYYEAPVRLNGRFYLDGGILNNQPVHASEATLTCSPYAGTARIAPDPAKELCFDPLHRLLPPDGITLRKYERQGFADALSSPWMALNK